MRDRAVTARILKSKRSVLLLGPRQVGKSTLVKGLRPDLYLNLAEEGLYIQYAKDPGRITKEIRALRSPSLIVIDEIQRVPALLNSVQSLIDDASLQHRYILTGSSARKLRKGGGNLLPGRVVLEKLDPMLLAEVSADTFSLDRALQIGMLPGIFLSDDCEGQEILASYVETYLREEILSEGLSRNLGAFARLLDTVAIVSGQWLNYSKLASDIEVPKETVRRYIALLEDTLIIHRLESFRPRAKLSRKTTQRDKILLFDVGIRNAILGMHSQRISPTERGLLFEQWLTLQIIAINNAYRKGWKITSYLDHNDNEVDLVIETASEIVGIEIKSSHTIRRDAMRGLQACEKLVGSYKPFRKIVAFTGEHELALENECRAVPYQVLLRELTQIDQGSAD